jgi:hypothetical protein
MGGSIEIGPDGGLKAHLRDLERRPAVELRFGLLVGEERLYLGGELRVAPLSVR